MKIESPRKRAGLLPKGQKNIGQKVIAPKKVEPRPVLVNGQITADHVDLRDEKGKRWGVVPLKEAIAIARELSIDLIQIGFGNPPVCVLKDFGKFMFEQSRERQAN